MSKPADPKPSLLDGKSVEAILLNTPVSREVAPGVFLEFTAMDDGRLMRCAESLEKIVGILQAAISLDAMMDSLTAVLAATPLVLRVALPEVTQLISVSLGLTPEQAAGIKLAHKVGILQGILEAEDIPLLVKNGHGLVSIFAGLPTPEAQAQATEGTAASGSLTGEPTTNS